MRMDKLTTKFQMALADAQSLAVGRDHQFIEPVHLLSALLDQEGGSVTYLLAQANVNTNALRSQLGDALDRLPRVEGVEGDVQISNELGRLLNVTDIGLSIHPHPTLNETFKEAAEIFHGISTHVYRPKRK